MTRAQRGIAAGVAIVGAGAIALAPVAPPASTARTTTVPVALTAAYTEPPLELFALSAQRAIGGLALAPLNPLIMAVAIAGGDEELLYAALRQSIDAPLWVADPSLEAIAQILPEELGGGTGQESTTTTDDGALLQFRNDVLWAGTDELRTAIADALGVPAGANDNPAAVLAEGFVRSASNLATGAVLAPLGIIPIAQAIAAGDEEGLYRAVRQYIDAPLWVADPAIEAVAEVLPDSLGGGTDGDPRTTGPADGAVMQFRNDVLWRATEQTRSLVATALDVDPDLDASDTETAGVAAASEPADVAPHQLRRQLSASDPVSAKAADGDTAKPDRPRPVRAAVKSLGKQVESVSKRIDRTVDKLTKPKRKAAPAASSASDPDDNQDTKTEGKKEAKKEAND